MPVYLKQLFYSVMQLTFLRKSRYFYGIELLLPKMAQKQKVQFLQLNCLGRYWS